jgi:hypothetical protein
MATGAGVTRAPRIRCVASVRRRRLPADTVTRPALRHSLPTVARLSCRDAPPLRKSRQAPLPLHPRQPLASQRKKLGAHCCVGAVRVSQRTHRSAGDAESRLPIRGLLALATSATGQSKTGDRVRSIPFDAVSFIRCLNLRLTYSILRNGLCGATRRLFDATDFEHIRRGFGPTHKIAWVDS